MIHRDRSCRAGSPTNAFDRHAHRRQRIQTLGRTVVDDDNRRIDRVKRNGGDIAFQMRKCQRSPARWDQRMPVLDASALHRSRWTPDIIGHYQASKDPFNGLCSLRLAAAACLPCTQLTPSSAERAHRERRHPKAATFGRAFRPWPIREQNRLIALPPESTYRCRLGLCQCLSTTVQSEPQMGRHLENPG